MRQSKVFRLFSDINKHVNQKHVCLQYLGHFLSKEVLMRHKEVCSRKVFMSVLPVYPTPGSEQTQINSQTFSFHINAVCYLCELRVESQAAWRPGKAYYLLSSHKVCAALIFCSNLSKFNQLMVIKVGKNALTKL